MYYSTVTARCKDGKMLQHVQAEYVSRVLCLCTLSQS